MEHPEREAMVRIEPGWELWARAAVRDVEMLQVDPRLSGLLRNAREFVFPALRGREKRVILDRGGVDSLQDEQENLPKHDLGHLFVRCWSAARPSANVPRAGVGTASTSPVPGDFPAVLQSPGAVRLSQLSNTLLFARPGSLLLLFQRPLLNIMAHLEFRKAALRKCRVCCFSQDVHYLSLISLLAKALLSTPWS